MKSLRVSNITRSSVCEEIDFNTSVVRVSQVFLNSYIISVQSIKSKEVSLFSCIFAACCSFSISSLIQIFPNDFHFNDSNEIINSVKISSDTVLLFFVSGLVLSYHVNDKTVIPLGLIEDGISEVSKSPDNKTIIVFTKHTDDFILFSTCLETIARVSFNELTLPNEYPVNVGWGSSETQFKGAGAKAKERETSVKPVLSNIDVNDYIQNDAPSICWHPNSLKFAILDSRKCLRIYSRDGKFLFFSSSSSLPIRSLHTIPMTWKSQYGHGYGILTPLSAASHGSYLSIWEENCLEHGTIELSNVENSKISFLSWNPKGSILAIGYYSNTIQLLTTTCYNAELKFELFSPHEQLIFIGWLELDTHMDHLICVRYNKLMKRLHIDHVAVFITPGPFPIYSNIIAVLSGSTILISPIKKGLIPPPLSRWKASSPSKKPIVLITPVEEDKIVTLSSDCHEMLSFELPSKQESQLGLPMRLLSSKMLDLSFLSYESQAILVPRHLLYADFTFWLHITVIWNSLIRDVLIRLDDQMEITFHLFLPSILGELCRDASSLFSLVTGVFTNTLEKLMITYLCGAQISFNTKITPSLSNYPILFLKDLLSMPPKVNDLLPIGFRFHGHMAEECNDICQSQNFCDGNLILTISGHLWFISSDQLPMLINPIITDDDNFCNITSFFLYEEHSYSILFLTLHIKKSSSLFLTYLLFDRLRMRFYTPEGINTDEICVSELLPFEHISILPNSTLLCGKDDFLVTLYVENTGSLETFAITSLVKAAIEKSIQDGSDFTKGYSLALKHRIPLKYLLTPSDDKIVELTPELSHRIELLVKSLKAAQLIQIMADPPTTDWHRSIIKEILVNVILMTKSNLAFGSKENETNSNLPGGDKIVNLIKAVIAADLLSYKLEAAMTTLSRYWDTFSTLDQTEVIRSSLILISREKTRSGADLLVRAALVIYSIPIALAICEEGLRDRDPQEYHNFLSLCKSQRNENRTRYLIDDHLGQYNKALSWLLAEDSWELSEILNYVEKHDLFIVLISNRNFVDFCQLKICPSVEFGPNEVIVEMLKRFNKIHPSPRSFLALGDLMESARLFEERKDFYGIIACSSLGPSSNSFLEFINHPIVDLFSVCSFLAQGNNCDIMTKVLDYSIQTFSGQTSSYPISNYDLAYLFALVRKSDFEVLLSFLETDVEFWAPKLSNSTSLILEYSSKLLTDRKKQEITDFDQGNKYDFTEGDTYSVTTATLSGSITSRGSRRSSITSTVSTTPSQKLIKKIKKASSKPESPRHEWYLLTQIKEASEEILNSAHLIVSLVKILLQANSIYFYKIFHLQKEKAKFYYGRLLQMSPYRLAVEYEKFLYALSSVTSIGPVFRRLTPSFLEMITIFKDTLIVHTELEQKLALAPKIEDIKSLL